MKMEIEPAIIRRLYFTTENIFSRDCGVLQNDI